MAKSKSVALYFMATLPARQALPVVDRLPSWRLPGRGCRLLRVFVAGRNTRYKAGLDGEPLRLVYTSTQPPRVGAIPIERRATQAT